MPPRLNASDFDQDLLILLDAYVHGDLDRRSRFTAHQYPGTQHGFNNDTTPRYDAAAAQLAWSRTVAFFEAQLVSAG